MTAEIIKSALAEHFPDKLPVFSEAYGELTVTVAREDIIDVLSFLRDAPSCRFTQLIDLCGVDYPERVERFEVVYHLLSMRDNMRVRVKLRCGEKDLVPSAISVYPAANWFEREVFDMYGVLFADHPDLRRILTDYTFSGYPLRKDFPLTGFTELRYDEAQKRTVYEPVTLTQDFRNFDYAGPWEGVRRLFEEDGQADQTSAETVTVKN